MAQPNAVDIFPQGDVVLVCGEKENTKKRLRVSSTFLKQASPVFKAMIGPHFREGRSLATSSKVEIPLPEDDPQAMELVCLVVHMRSDLVPTELDQKTLLKVTGHCDKYALLDATRPTVQQWLDLCVEEDPPISNTAAVDLMEVAFLFKCWKQVAKLGVLLVKRSTQDLVLLYSQRPQTPRVPMHLFYQLEYHRREQQRRIVEAIERQISELTEARHDVCDEHPCRTISALISHLVGELADVGIWPSSKIRMRSLEAIGSCVTYSGVDDFECAVKCSDGCALELMKTASHSFACMRFEIATTLQELPSKVKFDPRKKDDVMVGFA